MTARKAKQIVYGALYLVILVLIGGGAYALFAPKAPAAPPAPSSNCPGPACSAEGIVVGGFSKFISSPGYDTLLARVENHNTGFAAQSFHYSFDLYNASGTLLHSYPGNSFLYGGEVKYLVLPNIPVPAQFAQGKVAISDPVWVAAQSMGIAPQFGNPLPVTGSSVAAGTISVQGALTDGDPSAFATIMVVAVFYGRDGIAVGASQTQLDGIAPGETKAFSVAYPYEPNIDPRATKLYAYAMRP